MPGVDIDRRGCRARRRKCAAFPHGYAGMERLGSERVVLAQPYDVIACFLQVSEEIRLVGAQEIVEAAVAAHARRPAGEKAAARCAADRKLDVAVREPRPLCCQTVEIRRPGHRVAVARQRVGSHLVGDVKDDVRPAAGASRAGCRAGRGNLRQRRAHRAGARPEPAGPAD